MSFGLVIPKGNKRALESKRTIEEGERKKRNGNSRNKNKLKIIIIINGGGGNTTYFEQHHIARDPLYRHDEQVIEVQPMKMWLCICLFLLKPPSEKLAPSIRSQRTLDHHQAGISADKLEKQIKQ